ILQCFLGRAEPRERPDFGLNNPPAHAARLAQDYSPTFNTSILGLPIMSRWTGSNGLNECVSCQLWSAILRWTAPTDPWPSVGSRAIHCPLMFTSIHMW